MKRIISLILLMCVFLFGKIVGQTNPVTINSGVYLTVNDYKTNKLVEEAECTTEKEKFERHDIFSRPSFVVINKGKKTTYVKNDIYAYRDCENRVWRFYDNKEYEILEPKNIFIYRRSKILLNGLTIEKDPVFYFSNGAEGKVKELTLDNLKLTFSNNTAFYNILNAEFNSSKETINPDKAVHSYDLSHKMYKVNYLLNQSEK